MRNDIIIRPETYKDYKNFYHRVGFRTSSEFGIYPTQGIPMNEPKYMMCQEAYEVALNEISGYAVYDITIMHNAR